MRPIYKALALLVILLLLGTTPSHAQGVPLRALVRSCAPTVSDRTMLALISVESGGWPWALHDNYTNETFYPSTLSAAIELGQQRLNEGHLVDVGLTQVDSGNFPGYHLTLTAAFDPCQNVAVGGSILTRAYRQAVDTWGGGQAALYHALEIYNSGRSNGDDRYALAVWRAALDR